MTVYPFTIRLGSFQITGFGIMMMVAFLTAGWLMDQDLRRRGLNPEYAADITVAAVIGGILGAKLWFVALTGDAGALFSRGGLVWYGGFVGGAIAVLFNGWRRRIPLRLTLQVAAPALAAGHALGRVGCFMVGDDYGRPTTLPWGVRFPEGLPATTAGSMQANFGTVVPDGVDPSTILAVHPTQLYEVIALTLIFAVLWRLRLSKVGMGWVFGMYLVLAGTERFLVEIVRAKDDRFFGAFTLAQLTSVVLVFIGVALLAKWKRLGDPAIPNTLKV